MSELPTSFEEVEPIIAAPTDSTNSDAKLVPLQIKKIVNSYHRSNEIKALKLTTGLGGRRALTQREAAKKIGCSQRTVSNRVRGAMTMLANDPRVCMLYEELKGLEEY